MPREGNTDACSDNQRQKRLEQPLSQLIQMFEEAHAKLVAFFDSVLILNRRRWRFVRGRRSGDALAHEGCSPFLLTVVDAPDHVPKLGFELSVAGSGVAPCADSEREGLAVAGLSDASLLTLSTSLSASSTGAVTGFMTSEIVRLMLARVGTSFGSLRSTPASSISC